MILKQKEDTEGGTEPTSCKPEARNVENLRSLIRRLELYETTRTINQREEEANFVIALKKWLDGDDLAIDEWLSTL